ncbi:MAG TPA: adenylyltransferase/cytidyltransferase family protein, partial [Candidatus Polarisedimenticolia bacterium]|nr:adenylyltransferase/cytidyltransferase family protein [Candidatus Polarisedimenticolia bacterium]
MRLGLLGGTFDPIHRGHIAAARAAATLGLDRVLFVPANHPPHKDGRDLTGPYHRFAMVALGLAGQKNLCLSAHELARGGTSFTIDTVRHYVSKGHQVGLI